MGDWPRRRAPKRVRGYRSTPLEGWGTATCETLVAEVNLGAKLSATGCVAAKCPIAGRRECT